jgi:1-acyl-sn-glycerol-3-phosphate acyltransferase
MSNRVTQGLARIRRIAATGLAFCLFGIGAVAISVTWFPWLRLRSRDAETTRHRIHGAMQRIFRLFVEVCQGLDLLTVDAINVERLAAPGQLIVANHPTLLDVVFLVALLPRVDCIVKQQLWRNPFLRWPVRWAGYIPNSEPTQLLKSCAACLQQGHSLLVFPAGTRDAPNHKPLFKRGAAQIALAARCPITPIVITCEPSFLRKGEPWYRVPERSPHFTIAIGETIQPSVYVIESEAPTLAARRLTQLLAQRLGYNPPETNVTLLDRDQGPHSASVELPQ